MKVVSLCDFTLTMLQPWANVGFECIAVDIQHPTGINCRDGITTIGVDIRRWLPPKDIGIVFAFPPCTNLAVSGARWFKDKGILGLSEGLELVERCAAICDWSDAPWMLENPIGVIGSYWRKSDTIIQPWEFADYLDDPEKDNYTKATCLWIGNNFILPVKKPAKAPHRHDIHEMPPSVDRGDKRSMTPQGFAEAVFAANHKRIKAQ